MPQQPEGRPPFDAWMTMMTLTGKGITSSREAWNAWVAHTYLSEEQCREIAASSNVSFEELSCWPKIEESVKYAYQSRAHWHGVRGKVAWPKGEIDLRKPNSKLPESYHTTKFEGYIFPEFVHIRARNLESPINASGAVFLKGLRIVGTTFKSRADFSSTVFKGGLLIGDTTFEKGVNLRKSHFSENTVIDSSVFQGTNNFCEGECVKSFGMLRCLVQGALMFDERIFNEKAGFQNCTFEGVTTFSGASFRAKTQSPERSPIFFQDTRFSAPSSFRNAKFLSSYPDFTNTELYPVTDFSIDTKTERYWPVGITEPRKEARETCGIIRNLLANKGLHEDQHFFFRKEMEFAAASSNRRERFTYWVYRFLSDYGDSIQRPILCLALVWAFGWLSFGGFFFQTPWFLEACSSAQNLGVVERPYGTGAALSFANLFPPFGFSRSFFGPNFMGCLPATLKALSGLQTVLSLPFLFFLGLGLRQRFRLR